MTAPFRIERLAERPRADFDCGTEALNRYLAEQATQDMRRRLSVCFVAIEDRSDRVAAYYTLAAASIAVGDLAPELIRKLPRYPVVPAARIGRLAVDRAFQGRGLGGAILADAAGRIARSDAAAYALLVDAKDENAAAFYLRHDFLRFESRPQSLYLPLGRAKALL